MYGCFDFHGTATDLDAVFGSKPICSAWTPCHNIAPTDRAPIIIGHGKGERRTVLARFGWRHPFLASGQIINARAETVQQQTLFRQAFVERRCIVPVHGFFESSQTAASRQLSYFTSRSSPLAALAGLYTHAAGQRGYTFIVLTTWANALMNRCHARMPVMLDPAEAVAYLRGPSPAARALLKPYPAAGMHSHPVDEGNKPGGLRLAPEAGAPECL